ncbi:MAG: hypothetical protein L6R39_000093 [Caloplaca ligustica]|nr:MAG: hypothetical protein L6R39_000093 [Caloplaca ligustica]
MDSEDGQIFLRNLAQFVRTHEKALANALQLHRPDIKPGHTGPRDIHVSPSPLAASRPVNSTSSISSALAAAFSLGSLNFTSHNVRPAKLTLTSHHLFYLLSRFEEVSIPVGPLNIRTENLHAETSPANYVSFLGQAPRPHGRSDRDSIHSVSSVRSVMSGMSALWLGFGSSSSAAKTEKAQAQLMLDLKYLYSAFTKIPCLRLAPDRKARLIRGYEEFPFDTAVPLLVFKNLSALEICDVDFRQFFGWDKLAEQLRSLTLKRAHIDDPNDLFTSIVLDDMDKRRRRSSKAQGSPVLVWPSSPPARSAEAAKVRSPPSPRATEDMTKQSTSLETDRTLPSSKWRFLRHLSLADNALTSISADSLMPLANSLHSLDLSFNLFTEVPDGLSCLTVLRALNLSNCMIRSLQSLIRDPLPAITALNLRGNHLTSIAGVDRLLSLERLDLRENRIGDPTELARLTGLPDFREVWLVQNPFTKSHSGYRVTIFNLFRGTPGLINDISIDASGPTYYERKQLTDRVAESEPVSVVRSRQAPNHQPTSITNAQQGDFIESRELGQGPFPLDSTQDHLQASSTTTRSGSPKSLSRHSKKGTRRQRLVDLAVAEDVPVNVVPASLQRKSVDGASIVPRPDLQASKNVASNESFPGRPETPYHAGPGDSDGFQDARALTSSYFERDEALSSNSSQRTKLKAQVYRQKIEAFKQEVGSNWLSALSEEGWVRDRRADTGNASLSAAPRVRPEISLLSKS